MPDKYPLPYLQDLGEHLARMTLFSKIDLAMTYYQIQVALEDIPKYAVTTPFGLS